MHFTGTNTKRQLYFDNVNIHCTDKVHTSQITLLIKLDLDECTMYLQGHSNKVKTQRMLVVKLNLIGIMPISVHKHCINFEKDWLTRTIDWIRKI